MVARHYGHFDDGMTVGEVEQNVSLDIRSYACDHEKMDSNLAVSTLRRKSKSQMDLNDAHAGKDHRPLRSFQRQLQRHPLEPPSSFHPF